jgi:hypothetical protein
MAPILLPQLSPGCHILLPSPPHDPPQDADIVAGQCLQTLINNSYSSELCSLFRHGDNPNSVSSSDPDETGASAQDVVKTAVYVHRLMKSYLSANPGMSCDAGSWTPVSVCHSPCIYAVYDDLEVSESGMDISESETGAFESETGASESETEASESEIQDETQAPVDDSKEISLVYLQDYAEIVEHELRLVKDGLPKKYMSKFRVVDKTLSSLLTIFTRVSRVSRPQLSSISCLTSILGDKP